jgi:hypothetical protein
MYYSKELINFQFLFTPSNQVGSCGDRSELYLGGFWHLPGGIEGNHENLSVFWLRFELGHPKYMSAVAA